MSLYGTENCSRMCAILENIDREDFINFFSTITLEVCYFINKIIMVKSLPSIFKKKNHRDTNSIIYHRKIVHSPRINLLSQNHKTHVHPARRNTGERVYLRWKPRATRKREREREREVIIAEAIVRTNCTISLRFLAGPLSLDFCSARGSTCPLRSP